jgi:hypothetical protein
MVLHFYAKTTPTQFRNWRCLLHGRLEKTCANDSFSVFVMQANKQGSRFATGNAQRLLVPLVTSLQTIVVHNYTPIAIKRGAS